MNAKGKGNMRVGEKRLVGLLGDQDTISGFLLVGVGEANVNGQLESGNCVLVTPENTKDEILKAFRSLSDRQDIGVILINQFAANRIRETIDKYDNLFPSILEIPSKDQPYDFSKDSAMVRINRILGEE